MNTASTPAPPGFSSELELAFGFPGLRSSTHLIVPSDDILITWPVPPPPPPLMGVVVPAATAAAAAAVGAVMPLSCEAKSKETLCAMRDLASFDKEVTSSQCLAPRRYTDFMTSLALHLSFGFPVVSIIRVSSSGSDRSNRFGSPAPAPAAAAGDPHGDALEEENDDNEGAAAAAAAAAAGGGRGGAARVEKDLSARGLFRRPLPLCFIIIIIISRSNSIDEFTPHSPKDKKGQQGGGRQAPQYEQRRRRKRDEPLPLVPKQGTSSSSLLPSSLSSSSSSPSSSSSAYSSLPN